MSESDQRLPGPPSQDVINLAGADIAISTVFLVFISWIAWKHGKPGMVAWPIFVSCFVARLVAAIYHITRRDKPEIPNTVTIFTGSCVVACVTLTIIGVIYECNIILPTPPKRKREKLILGFLHLTNTAGLSIAMYGGSPKDTPSGVINPLLNKLGNLLMVQTLVVTCAWMMPTYRKIQRYACLEHPNAAAARHMFWATALATGIWFVRIAHGTVYAFNGDSAALDPVLGSFQTKLVLIFGTWLGASVPLAVGGWLGMRKVPLNHPLALAAAHQHGLGGFAVDPETALRMERRRTLGEMRREHQRSRAAGADDVEMLTTLDAPGGGQFRGRFHSMKKMISQTFSVSSRD